MAAYLSTRTFLSVLLRDLGFLNHVLNWDATVWFSQNHRVWLAHRRNSSNWCEILTHLMLQLCNVKHHSVILDSRGLNACHPLHHYHQQGSGDSALESGFCRWAIKSDILHNLDIFHTYCPSWSDLDSVRHKPALYKSSCAFTTQNVSISEWHQQMSHSSMITAQAMVSSGSRYSSRTKRLRTRSQAEMNKPSLDTDFYYSLWIYSSFAKLHDRWKFYSWSFFIHFCTYSL